jgi:hypothetical protein
MGFGPNKKDQEKIRKGYTKRKINKELAIGSSK